MWVKSGTGCPHQWCGQPLNISETEILFHQWHREDAVWLRRHQCCPHLWCGQQRLFKPRSGFFFLTAFSLSNIDSDFRVYSSTADFSLGFKKSGYYGERGWREGSWRKRARPACWCCCRRWSGVGLQYGARRQGGWAEAESAGWQPSSRYDGARSISSFTAWGKLHCMNMLNCLWYTLERRVGIGKLDRSK